MIWLNHIFSAIPLFVGINFASSFFHNNDAIINVLEDICLCTSALNVMSRFPAIKLLGYRYVYSLSL